MLIALGKAVCRCTGLNWLMTLKATLLLKNFSNFSNETKRNRFWSGLHTQDVRRCTTILFVCVSAVKRKRIVRFSEPEMPHIPSFERCAKDRLSDAAWRRPSGSVAGMLFGTHNGTKWYRGGTF